LTDIQKYSNIKCMKIHPVGAGLFHGNGQTDMTKLIVALHSFLNMPKLVSCLKEPSALDSYEHCSNM